LIPYLLDLLDSHTNWSEQRITLKENFLKLFHCKVKCIFWADCNIYYEKILDENIVQKLGTFY